jgi:hypothetical protein
VRMMADRRFLEGAAFTILFLTFALVIVAW